MNIVLYWRADHHHQQNERKRETERKRAKGKKTHTYTQNGRVRKKQSLIERRMTRVRGPSSIAAAAAQQHLEYQRSKAKQIEKPKTIEQQNDYTSINALKGCRNVNGLQ